MPTAHPDGMPGQEFFILKAITLLKQGPESVAGKHDQAMQDLIESGMKPGEARRRAAALITREHSAPRAFGAKPTVAVPPAPRGVPAKPKVIAQEVQKGGFWGLVDFIKKAPPGMEHVVRKLKKVPGVENPWAVSWGMKKKGAKVRKALSKSEMLLKAVDVLAEAKGTAPIEALNLLAGSDEVDRIVAPPATGLWAWRPWSEADLHYTENYGPDRMVAALSLLDRPYGVRV